MMDEIVLSANTQTIQEGSSSAVNISGLWQAPFGRHSLKISNGAAVAQSLIEIIPNPDGLAGSWNFDEGSGNKAYDGSGSGKIRERFAVRRSERLCRHGERGKFEFWDCKFHSKHVIKTAYNAAQKRIIAYFDTKGWGLMLAAGGYPRLAINDGTSYSAISNQNKADGLWHHIVGIANRGQAIRIYIDGIETTYSSQNTDLSGAISNSAPTLIGVKEAKATEFFNGAIDEVRIWNKTFAPDETVTMKRII